MKVMRTTVATVVAATLSMSAFSVFAEASLTGAGATFPAPVYAKWADTYQKETGNKVNYQGIGSSGGGAKPFPVAKSEIENVLRRIGKANKNIEVEFKVGDTVKVLSGPFSGMEGVVDSMNDDTQVATVLIILFGRETPTDINYIDLKKAM